MITPIAANGVLTLTPSGNIKITNTSLGATRRICKHVEYCISKKYNLCHQKAPLRWEGSEFKCSYFWSATWATQFVLNVSFTRSRWIKRLVMSDNLVSYRLHNPLQFALDFCVYTGQGIVYGHWPFWYNNARMILLFKVSRNATFHLMFWMW